LFWEIKKLFHIYERASIIKEMEQQGAALRMPCDKAKPALKM